MNMELLELCGFESEEIKKQMPRIERAFANLQLNDEDLKRAVERVKKYFSIDLSGMRKTLGIWLKELIDLAVARDEGKTVIYLSYPPIPELTAALFQMPEQIYVVCPEITMDLTIGRIFDKLTPLIEQAESSLLAPGLANCSMLQARLGAIEKGIIPKPDILVTSDMICDQAPKLDELMADRYGIPLVQINNCFGGNGEEYPDVELWRIEYTAQELKNAVAKIGGLANCEVTGEMASEGIKKNYALLFATGSIYDMLSKADPRPLSHADFTQATNLARCYTRTAMKQGIDAMNTLIRDVRGRINAGFEAVKKGSPSVFMFVPNWSDPSIFRMIEGAGLALTNDLDVKASEAKASSRYTEMWDRVAYLNVKSGARNCPIALIKAIEGICQSMKMDGLLFYTHFACRHLIMPIARIKDVVEKDLGIPVLPLEGDVFFTRDYSAEALRTRVETFAEIVRASKAAKAK